MTSALSRSLESNRLSGTIPVGLGIQSVLMTLYVCWSDQGKTEFDGGVGAEIHATCSRVVLWLGEGERLDVRY